MSEASVARIEQIIANADEELKSVLVEKPIEYEVDEGNLLILDNNILDEKKIRDTEEVDSYLKSIARDGVQVLLSKIWQLPSHQIDNMIYATLPKPSTRLPREKIVPKGRADTKWQKYAREKGFNQRKKDKKVWDKTLQRWVPRFGYQKVLAEKEKNWVIEVPATADPYEDQYAKKSNIKKENIAKNEFQRLRNIAHSRKIKLPGVGITGNELAGTKDISRAMVHAHQATASLGKFQKRLPNEKVPKGKKRKAPDDFVGDTSTEKKKSLDILGKMKRKELDLEGAVNKQIRDENVILSHPSKNDGGKRRSKMGGRHHNKSDQKGAAKGKGFTKLQIKDKAKRENSFGSSSIGGGAKRTGKTGGKTTGRGGGGRGGGKKSGRGGGGRGGGGRGGGDGGGGGGGRGGRGGGRGRN